MAATTTQNAVRIEGLRELELAFKLYGRGMEKGVREALEAASEPVRTDAQTMAVASIPKITIPWSRMRVGVRRRTAYAIVLTHRLSTSRTKSISLKSSPATRSITCSVSS